VRAAYGVFFDYPHFYEYSGMLKDPPWGYGVTLTNPGGGFEDPWRGVPGGNPFPAPLTPGITRSGIALTMGTRARILTAGSEENSTSAGG
jgi:hypothetical protein